MLTRFFRNVHWVLTLRCEDHRRLQAMRLDGPLSFKDRLAMRGHWLVCGPCREVVRQLSKIDAAAHQLSESTAEMRLSGDARQRIADKLRNASGDSKHDSGENL